MFNFFKKTRYTISFINMLLDELEKKVHEPDFIDGKHYIDHFAEVIKGDIDIYQHENYKKIIQDAFFIYALDFNLEAFTQNYQNISLDKTYRLAIDTINQMVDNQLANNFIDYVNRKTSLSKSRQIPHVISTMSHSDIGAISLTAFLPLLNIPIGYISPLAIPLMNLTLVEFSTMFNYPNLKEKINFEDTPERA